MAPGRRWSVLNYMADYGVMQDPDGHELHVFRLGHDFIRDPRLEYRMLFDKAHGLWRIDVRVHADGG